MSDPASREGAPEPPEPAAEAAEAAIGPVTDPSVARDTPVEDLPAAAYDAQFADIVAHWDETADDSAARPRDGDTVDGPRDVDTVDGPRDGDTVDGPRDGDTVDGPRDVDTVDGTADPVEGTAESAGDTGNDHARDGNGVTAEASVEPSAAGEPTTSGEPVVPWRGTAGSPTLDEEDEHYVPPPPAPLPAGDLHFWAIVVGLVGGPLLLLYLMTFGRGAPSWWLMVAVAMSVGGFALLVTRLPARRDDEDDDNGARI